MASIRLSKTDEITMRLVHYFVTKENYQPILVAGLENEIWLENIEKPFDVIRINNNYIHNNEQLDFDRYKTKTVIKEIKKKTFLLSCNTLSLSDNVILDNHDKHNQMFRIDSVKDLANEDGILKLFPEIKNDKIETSDAMEFFKNVTEDINKQTEKQTKLYEKTFKRKKTYITYGLIALNVFIFLMQILQVLDVDMFSLNKALVLDGDYYRLFTSAFFHVNIIHLVCNMYSLYLIGKEVETVLGKTKFIFLYILSIFSSSLLSCLLNGANSFSIGASGAIFGLLGALLYFGYHYRLYLGNSVISNVIQVIVINLIIGFSVPGIDNYAHIGGLIGGFFAAMIVGVEGKTNKKDMINGIIVTVLLFAFLLFMLLKK